MKTRFIFSLCASALLLLSCQKDELNNEQQKEEGPIITASYDTDDTKTELDSDGKTPKWSAGDQVWVSSGANSKTITLKASGTPTLEYGIISSDGRSFEFMGISGATTTYAVYPASCAAGTASASKVQITIPSNQDGTFKNANICVAIGNGTSIKFKNAVAVLKVRQNKVNQTFNFSAGKAVAGTFTADASGNLSDGSSTSTSISCTKFTGTGYFALAPGTSSDKPKYKVGDSGTEKTLPEAAKTITRNKLYTVTAPGTGLFSVSSSKKVIFSPGNLQAVYSTSTSSYSWQFAENQWKYIGNAAGNTTIGTSQTDKAVVDLFGWSTAATNYGINTSTSNSTYSGNFRDWGGALPSSYGTWRTLSGGSSGGEWNYLLTERTVNGGKGEGKSYLRATINSDATSRYGMIIYPDNYTAQTGATSYTSSEWQTMEAAGCVFLPAAGYRFGSDVSNVGSYGYYWSSTPNGSNGAYDLYFRSGNVYPAFNYVYRYYGQSVRLVQE